MDSSNSTATQPTMPQAPTAVNPNESGSKKMIIMLIVGVVVIILLVFGIYWFLSKQQSPKPSQTEQITVPKAPVISSIKDALDEDLNSINVQASEGDFKDVDSDLQTL